MKTVDKLINGAIGVSAVAFVTGLMFGGNTESASPTIQEPAQVESSVLPNFNPIMEIAQRQCFSQIYAEGDGITIKQFKVEQLNGTVAEVSMVYNRYSNGRSYKGVGVFCDVNVPQGTQLVNGELIRS